jgi:hypothetical protein
MMRDDPMSMAIAHAACTHTAAARAEAAQHSAAAMLRADAPPRWLVFAR